MKVPYNQLPDAFKKLFESTGHGDEILYAIYKRKGYDETSFWEWNTTGREDDSETIAIELADRWNGLSEENQRTMLQTWMTDLMNTFNKCRTFMEKHIGPGGVRPKED